MQKDESRANLLRTVYTKLAVHQNTFIHYIHFMITQSVINLLFLDSRLIILVQIRMNRKEAFTCGNGAILSSCLQALRALWVGVLAWWRLNLNQNCQKLKMSPPLPDAVE